MLSPTSNLKDSHRNSSIQFHSVIWRISRDIVSSWEVLLPLAHVDSHFLPLFLRKSEVVFLRRASVVPHLVKGASRQSPALALKPCTRHIQVLPDLCRPRYQYSWHSLSLKRNKRVVCQADDVRKRLIPFPVILHF